MHLSFIAYIWLFSFALLPAIRALPVDTPPKAPPPAYSELFPETSTRCEPAPQEDVQPVNSLQHGPEVIIQLQPHDFVVRKTQEDIMEYVSLTKMFPSATLRIEKDERRNIIIANRWDGWQQMGTLTSFRLLEKDGTLDDHGRLKERYYVGFIHVEDGSPKYFGAIQEVRSPIIPYNRMNCPKLEPPPGQEPSPELGTHQRLESFPRPESRPQPPQPPSQKPPLKKIKKQRKMCSVM
ncbi:hypothetical protein C8R42DRAFT_660318 [Lentinula raphanica]|nr:hypothetical protein C8R42DRAFT_660318 [Lentinula raphanica]